MEYKADLHIHTVLSPCGSLEMSPKLIIQKAKSIGLSIIGITDHNSTLNAEVAVKLGYENGIFVVPGAEITTKEEVHCLCFMPDLDTLALFELFIESQRNINSVSVGNKFEQLIVDEDENIIGEIDSYLVGALNIGISDLQKKVTSLNGIFIPAHVDRPYFSLSSQLGFIPTDLEFDVLEITPYAEKNGFFETFPWFSGYNYINSSDAHYLQDVGKAVTIFNLEELSFDCLKEAIKTYNIIHYKK